MTCPECGKPLDVDTIHIHHTCDDIECPTCHGQGRCWVRLGADDWDWEVCPTCDHCYCPEVCADCCTDPDCALRPDQETPMTDPTPLTADEIADFHEHPAYRGYSVDTTIVRRLFATVKQVRRERDTAYVTIRRLLHGAKPKMTLGHRFHRWEIPVFGGEDQHEPMSPDEAEAIRRARAVPGVENEGDK